MEVLKIIEGINPTVISKARGKLDANCTRDKKQFLKTVQKILFVLDILGYEIELKKKAP